MRSLRTGALVLAICILSPSCGETPEESHQDLMAHAEYLVREARWADAIDVLKQYLVVHPEDSGAHFYLGRCWLNVPEFKGHEGPWLVLAEGELNLALDLFHEQGGKSTIERFSDEYFQVICHLERAKVYLKQLTYLADRRGYLAGATAETIITELRQAIADAKAINPDSPDVWAFEHLLDTLEAPSENGSK
ncbi:MAG: hypothetical protein U9Q79_06045 [Candidatus Hydrogenedentes bacterium]|nr:hypothetical protein [Candidatus Hydrogenedentota bacterium]